MKKAKKIQGYNRTLDNDIRYRGPLSYRHLMILGWLGILLIVVRIWVSLGISIVSDPPEWFYTLNILCSVLGRFALPLLLLANFCIILDEKHAYEQLLKKYATLTLAVIIVYVIVFQRYLFGIVNLFTNNSEKAAAIIS